MRVEFLIDTRQLTIAGEGNRGDKKKILFLLEALTQCNLQYLRTHRATPGIYESGVVYKPEIRGITSKTGEVWKDIPHILRDGEGDCEDLACWRIAELRRHGVRAKAALRDKFFPEMNMTLIHVLVRYPNGRMEDPSKRLGMEGDY